MPTYQTAPNYPAVFPDEEVSKNPYGFRSLKGNTLLVRGETEPAHPAHSGWKQEADRVALARVQNTLLAKQKMMYQPASMKGKYGYTTYRGDFDSVRGGVTTTKEGEKLVKNLVRDRKYQYDALNEATFQTIPQNRLQVSLPPAETYKLDNLFLSILSNLTSGSVKSIYTEIGSLISELMSTADRIPEDKVDSYILYTSQIVEALNVLGTEQYGLISKKYTADMYSLGSRVKRLGTFLRKLAELRGRPTREKSAVLQAMRSSLLAEAQQDLQSGALGLYPGVEEARINREMYEGPAVGRPPVAARRQARQEEQDRVNALERSLGRQPRFERDVDIQEL
jgi:hypothetical protein